MQERSEPVGDLLSRFTPAPALDRDSLVFEAGRRSAGRPWLWIGVYVFLTLGQGATMALLWPRAKLLEPIPELEGPGPFVIPSLPPPPSEFWTPRTSPDDAIAGHSPVSAGEYVDSVVPVRAGAIAGQQLLDD